MWSCVRASICVRDHQNVERGSKIYSDALRSYRNVGVDGFVHEFVDHTEALCSRRRPYEWSGELLEPAKSVCQRHVCLRGALHLQAYCDEQAFRFNNRKVKDADRLDHRK